MTLSMDDLPVSGVAVVVGVLLVFVYTLLAPWRKRTTFPDLPWIGSGPSLWARWISVAKGRQWLEDGYRQHSAHGRSYIFTESSGVEHVMIPNDQTSWLVDQPDHLLSATEAHYDALAVDFAFGDTSFRQGYADHVLHTQLTRKLNDNIPHVWDEIRHCFDEQWGTNTDQWNEVVVFESISNMVAHISNRMLVGLPLCRNKDYLQNVEAFAGDVITCLIANSLIPRFLRSFLMRIVWLPNRYHYKRVAKHTMPLVKRRLADFEAEKAEIPEDYITWHIRVARKEKNQWALDPDFITRSLLASAFGALHTTSATATATLIDLVSSNPSSGYIDAIREEATRVYSESESRWTKQALNKLVRADSALKESLRMLDFMPYIARKVVAKDGVKSPDGWSAPYGSRISVNVLDRVSDPSVYPDPLKYDALRFSRMKEELEAKNEHDSEAYLKVRSLGLTSTGMDFPPFGHGRHAWYVHSLLFDESDPDYCSPGRFFVQVALKMLLAYMTMNYDIEHLPDPPPKVKFGLTTMPPMKAKIRVRRRAGTAPVT